MEKARVKEEKSAKQRLQVEAGNSRRKLYARENKAHKDGEWRAAKKVLDRVTLHRLQKTHPRANTVMWVCARVLKSEPDRKTRDYARAEPQTETLTGQNW